MNDKQRLLASVRQRIDAEGLDQRSLAAQLGTTQGHLSKILRGQFERRSRVVRQLESFAAGADVSGAQRQLVSTCLRVAGRSPSHMHFALSVMHFVDEISVTPARVTRAIRKRRKSR